MSETTTLTSKVELLERKIQSSKRDTELITQQIEKLKARMNDEDLTTSSQNVPKLTPNSNHLKLYQKLKGHQNKIATVRWNKDSTHLMSVSQDGFMIIWDAVTGLKLNAVILDSEWVLTGAYSPNGQLALSAGLKNSCVIYNVATPRSNTPQRQKNYVSNGTPLYQNLQPIKTILKGHRCYISDCDFVDNNSILTSSGDLTCALWDIDKSHKMREFTNHLGDVLCISLQQGTPSPLFVSGACDGFAKVWDIRTPMPVQQFQVSQSDVTTVKFFPDSGSFSTGSDDGTVRLFDLRADCQLSQYSLPKTLHLKLIKRQEQYYHSESKSMISQNMGDSMSANSEIDILGISSIDFSKSGRLMYVCYSELGCLVWDVLKNEIVEEIQGHQGRINQVCRSPDGIAVCTASWDSTINVWSS